MSENNSTLYAEFRYLMTLNGVLLQHIWRRGGYEINVCMIAPVCYEIAPCINESKRR